MLSALDKSNLKHAISKYKAKAVAIQIPEGLKTKVQEIAKEIERFDVVAVIFVDPCFGACDIKDYEARLLGCGLLIHFGHSPMIKKTEVPTLYIEYKMNINPIPIIKKNITKLDKYKKIGLLTTVQHVDCLQKIKKFLEENKKQVFIGRSNLKYDGQILGCNYQSAKSIEKKVDCFVYIGTGTFHPLGVLHNVKKGVFMADLENKTLRKIDDLTYQKKLIMKKEKFKDARIVGLIVSTKKGQLNRNVFEIKKKIEKMNKEVYILVMDFISQEKIEGLKLDVLVNTACPRIEDDSAFKQTLINLRDI